MLKLPPVNIERLLVGLVGDAVLDLAPEHHLRAVHEVEHHVLQSRLQGRPIDYVEVYVCVCRYLDSGIALDIVNETSLVDCVVLNPFHLLREIVHHKLEKQDLGAAADYQGLIVDHIHRAQVFVMNFLLIKVLFALVLIIIKALYWNSETLSLSVECVNFISICVVKRFLRKVFLIALHFDDLMRFLNNLHCFIIEEKVMMFLIGAVKEVDKDQFTATLVYEAAVDEGVWEVVNWHCVVVKAQSFVDI